MLSMKLPADKILLVVLESLFVTAQESIAISLIIRAAATEDREEPAAGLSIKMRALWIITLSPARVA